MDSYLMMLYVTLDQESALKSFFSQQGWAFLKPDLSVITDKLGPVMSLSTQTSVPAQATCTFPAETDIFSTVPENSVHIVTETDSLSAVPENTIHIQLETLDQPEVKSRSSRKRNTKSDQTKPSAKFPRLKLQLENKSGSAELPEKEQSKHIIQTENATYEPVFVDNVNRIIVKEEAVDSDYEPDNDDNDNVNDSESTDTCIDESFKQTSADNDASGSRDVTEGDGEQDDETGAGTEERVTQKQRKLPTSGKRKKRQYDMKLLTLAYKEVLEKGISVYRAARMFGVPESTLRERTLGIQPPPWDDFVATFGPSTTFTKDEEKQLLSHASYMASVGHGYSNQEFMNLATDFALSLKRKSPSDPAFGRSWMDSFKKRNPDLSKYQKGSIKKTDSSSQNFLDRYFEELESVMTRFCLTDKPESIWFIDETGIVIERAPVILQSQKGSHQQKIKDKMVTIYAGGNAAGALLPPYYVFPGEAWNDKLLNGACPGSAGATTESGSTNSAVLLEYLDKHFLKHVPIHDDSPLLVLLDGHKSFTNLTLSHWGKTHNTVFYVLPLNPSAASPYQLSVACFGFLKSQYYSEIRDYLHRAMNKQINQNQVVTLSSKAYNKGFTRENLITAFRQAGILPLDREKFVQSKTAPPLIQLDQDFG